MNSITPELIAAFGTAVVAPILAVIKVNADAGKRKDKRDTQIALIEKRIEDCEKKVDSIDELKDAINAINLSLAKIQTLIEIYIAKVEK